MSEKLNILSFDARLGIEYSDYASKMLDHDYWVVKAPFTYYIDNDPNKKITIPKGYLTDGASVPKILWSLVPPWGSYGQAVVLHDHMCEYLEYEAEDGDYGDLTRKQADDIFLKAMTDLEVPKVKRVIIYLGVRLWARLSKANQPRLYSKKLIIENELRREFETTGNWK